MPVTTRASKVVRATEIAATQSNIPQAADANDKAEPQSGEPQRVNQAPSSSNTFPDDRFNMPIADRSLWPQLQNVVSTFAMSCMIDLTLLARNARNCEYNPKRFAAAIVRIRNPKTTCLVFANGNCVVTGAKSLDDSRLAARKYVRIVQKLGFVPQFEDFKVRNIVASAAALPQVPSQKSDKRLGIVRQREFIRLDGFAMRHHKFANYTPETFAGCVYKMMRPSICLLIFPNGKIVFTGAKSLNDLDVAYRLIVPAVLEFRM